MKIALGIPLLLLVVTTTRPDDPPKSTQSCNAGASTNSAERDASPDLWSAPVASTEAPPAADTGTSPRLLHTVRETSPDYNHSCEATFGEDRLHPSSDNVEEESSAVTQGRGTSLAPPTATVSRSEEASALALDTVPEPANWIAWLPEWCRHWPLYGTLGVPRDIQLQAFAEALAYHTVGIGNYWVQAQESNDTDEYSNSQEPSTSFVSIMVQQVEALQEFYRWIYQQLMAAEDIEDNDFNPESLYHFLDALQRHAALVESVCNWSPSMRFMCDAPDSEILHNFFRVMDEQSIWMNILNRWAASEYNRTAASHRNPRMWLPLNLNEDAPSEVSHFSARNQKAGNSASGVEAVSNSVCTTEEKDMGSNKNFGDLPSEATAHSSYSVTQLEQQKQNNQEGKLPKCESQGMSKSGHEAAQLIGTSGIPISNQETEILFQNGGDELGAASAHPQNGYGSLDDDNRDEGFEEEYLENVWLVEDWMRESAALEEQGDKYMLHGRQPQFGSGEGNLYGCSATPVLQELGSGFIPHFVLYVTCNEQDGACEPPEKCTPMSSEVTVEMAPWATLPDFPHKLLGVKEVPNDRLLVTLLVASYCVCEQPHHATN